MACGVGVLMFLMRFTARTASPHADDRAGQYSAALEMCSWAEDRGCPLVVLSEHHGIDDGYLPAPVAMAAAIAGRTERLQISVSALVLPLYEPVRLAEELAVVDLISRGRVSYVVGIGYRPEEFAMFGVDRLTRGVVVEHRVPMLQALWRGETVDVDGRPVAIFPLPYTPGGPRLSYGGGSEPAARRAARLGLLFVSDTADPALRDAYRDEASRAGVTPVGCILPPVDAPLTTFVADDPDAAWAEIGEHLLNDATSYDEWTAHRPGASSGSRARTVADLKAENGTYRIWSVDQALEWVRSGKPLVLQPLAGGIPADVGWRYLETAAAVVAKAGE